MPGLANIKPTKLQMEQTVCSPIVHEGIVLWSSHIILHRCMKLLHFATKNVKLADLHGWLNCLHCHHCHCSSTSTFPLPLLLLPLDREHYLLLIPTSTFPLPLLLLPLDREHYLLLIPPSPFTWVLGSKHLSCTEPPHQLHHLHFHQQFHHPYRDLVSWRWTVN
jgi:hypothetical protein